MVNAGLALELGQADVPEPEREAEDAEGRDQDPPVLPEGIAPQGTAPEGTAPEPVSEDDFASDRPSREAGEPGVR